MDAIKAIDVKNLYRISITTSLNVFTMKSINEKLTDTIRMDFQECIIKTKSGVCSPKMNSLMDFLSRHSSIREYEIARGIFEQLDKIDYSKKTPCKGNSFSKIMKSFYMSEFSKIPPFIDFMSMPRTSAAICCSYNLEEYNRIASIVNSGVKIDFNEKMSIWESIDTIVSVFYPNTNKVPIVKCSIPIIEIILSLKKHRWNEEMERKATSLIKFIMVIEKINADNRNFEEDCSITEFLKENFPFKKYDGMNKEMFGIGDGSNNHEMLSNGKIKDETFRRHNLAILEGVLLSCFLVDPKQNEIIERVLQYVSEQDKIEWSLIFILPTVFRMISYVSDFHYVDSISGYNCLHYNYIQPTYQYPDLYGITEEDNFLSHSPRITFDNEFITEFVWKSGISGFERVFFDNNLDEIVKRDPNGQGSILLNAAHGFSLVVDFIATIPIILERINERDFSDVLHVVLKGLIAYPSHFLPRLTPKTLTFKLCAIQHEKGFERIPTQDEHGNFILKLIRVGDVYHYI